MASNYMQSRFWKDYVNKMYTNADERLKKCQCCNVCYHCYQFGLIKHEFETKGLFNLYIDM